MDNLTNNVTELSEIQNLMLSEYNYTVLTSRIFKLESENVALRNDIHNFTQEMEDLTDDIESLKDEPDDFMPLGGFVFGLLGILIAIVAVILATRKSESEKPPEEKDEFEEDKDRGDQEDTDI